MKRELRRKEWENGRSEKEGRKGGNGKCERKGREEMEEEIYLVRLETSKQSRFLFINFKKTLQYFSKKQTKALLSNQKLFLAVN